MILMIVDNSWNQMKQPVESQKHISVHFVWQASPHVFIICLNRYIVGQTRSLICAVVVKYLQ